MEYTRIQETSSPKIGDKMKYPTIRSVNIIGEKTLLVDFSNNEKRRYDVTPC
ncbi:Uncharacterized protein dnl_56990 [Desulfonema limicola]|uniref:Uncharacterized protein n=1 Tax=Desulfonema limicola TaxID=45656 RepID=A0A975BDK3_9BACT|nr:Uncharacterized protein dnl_56990 [Desulfonema limicola]